MKEKEFISLFKRRSCTITDKLVAKGHEYKTAERKSTKIKIIICLVMYMYMIMAF